MTGVADMFEVEDSTGRVLGVVASSVVDGREVWWVMSTRYGLPEPKTGPYPSRWVAGAALFNADRSVSA